MEEFFARAGHGKPPVPGRAGDGGSGLWRIRAQDVSRLSCSAGGTDQRLRVTEKTELGRRDLRVLPLATLGQYQWREPFRRAVSCRRQKWSDTRNQGVATWHGLLGGPYV